MSHLLLEITHLLVTVVTDAQNKHKQDNKTTDTGQHDNNKLNIDQQHTLDINFTTGEKEENPEKAIGSWER